MSQELQGQRRALYHASIGATVANLGRPPLPEGGGIVQLPRALVAIHRVDVVIVVSQDHPALFTLLQFKAGGRGRLLDLPLERLCAGEGKHLVGTIRREESGSEQLQPGGPRAVLETRHESHAHGHPAAAAAHASVNLGMLAGRPAVLGHRHEVGQTDDPALGGAERGLEDVGAGKVALGGGPPTLGVNRPGATPFGVEQRGKHTTAVEAGKTTPVDCSVQSNQGRRSHVANQPIVGDWTVANRARAPAGGIGRRLRLDVSHRPSISRGSRILHRRCESPTLKHLFPILMRPSLLLLALLLVACRPAGRPTSMSTSSIDRAALTRQLSAQLDRVRR